MVNNFKQIRELLEFRSEDDMYFCQILQRKKDAKAGEKVNGTNNNSRLVKAYYVSSLEYYDFIEPEIIQLCKIFNARAGINLNRRSYKKMALQHLKKITDQLINEDFTKAYKAYSSVVGAYNHDSDKKWIIDLDGEDENTFDFVDEVTEFINSLQPTDVTDKFIARIYSKNGSHLITSPFNVHEFHKEFPQISVQKNNPTNIYIP